ncbi:MAG: hypothetical protein HYS77_08750, partial [Candidatus Rokubacteria bacterium]|nr:hypothetical protein [Candidatus Rokubacteria bacterium]
MSAMWPLFWPGVGFVAAVLVALLLRTALKRGLRRRVRGRDGLAAVLQAVRGPSLLWVVVLGLYVAIEVASETERLGRRLSQQLALVLEVAIILS